MVQCGGICTSSAARPDKPGMQPPTSCPPAHLNGYLANEELVLVGGGVHHATAQLHMAAARAAGAAAAAVRRMGRRHHHGRPAHHVHVLQLAAAAHQAVRHAGQPHARLGTEEWVGGRQLGKLGHHMHNLQPD